MCIIEENIDFIPNSVYDTSKSPNGGDKMTASEILTAAFKAVETTQANVAIKYGLTPQQLNGLLQRNTLKVEDFIEILDLIGIDVSFTIRSTGEELQIRNPGHGRRVKAMVNRVKYDTANATMLANNFYADGVNEYTEGKALELYIDKENRYFFAEYSCWEGVKDRITPVTANDAAAFIEKYGTKIKKRPM